MNEIFCKIDNKGAISGSAAIFSIFSLIYGIKWHLGVKQWFFWENWFTYLFILYTSDNIKEKLSFWEKSLVVKNEFSSQIFEFSLLMARGPPKMQIFWNFLVILYSDPIRIALKLCSHFCLWKSWNHLRITHSYYNVRRIKQIDYIIIQTIIPLIHYVNFE